MPSQSFLQVRSIKAAFRNLRHRLRVYRDRQTAASLLTFDYPTSAGIHRALSTMWMPREESSDPWFAQIEAHRAKWLIDQSPLVDGTLGEPGIYDVGETISGACTRSKPPRAARMLYRVIRELKPKQVIELGTNVGISAAYIAAALKENGDGGRIITLDSSQYRQALARSLHTSLGLDNVTYVQGLFSDTLKSTLTENDPCDLAFIDGHHQYEPTLEYYNQVLEHCSNHAMLVFDDIRWSDGMKKAWKHIQADDRFGLVVDLQSVGLCALDSSASESSTLSGCHANGKGHDDARKPEISDVETLSTGRRTVLRPLRTAIHAPHSKCA